MKKLYDRKADKITFYFYGTLRKIKIGYFATISQVHQCCNFQHHMSVDIKSETNVRVKGFCHSTLLLKWQTIYLECIITDVLEKPLKVLFL